MFVKHCLSQQWLKKHFDLSNNEKYFMRSLNNKTEVDVFKVLCA